ncbi:MAG: hypothetical protein Q8P41_00570 [Pseudomonadota bacterium]|nr:hypothetical protein [Pseudomonadota bacterium]
MRTFLLGIAAMVLGSGAGGCATVGTVQTARPIAPGSVQVGLEPGLWGVEGRGWLPTANVAVRYGLGRRFDVGARLGAGGIGASAKVALTDPDEQVVASLAPMVGGFGVALFGVGTKAVHAQLPLIVGVGMRGGHELVVAPKIVAWHLSGSAGLAGARSTVVGAGGTIGVSLRVAPGVRLLPEIGMVQPVYGKASTRIAFWDIDMRAGVPLYQATVGVLLGGER